ncbi:DUF3939 domain-containing protein [Paenibacillus sp. J22TS3]|uniref:DUF3939 domain-containing protein n=1 Tax=Paenibacillus sp. J22TS3 TaxID=2807192 RepID=UPI001B22286D|nr:DUF3939 domain-containing protein [Paenibacillus sp. J22TS3]GIP20122.1 hypothetical protein J22TS3_03970 [Paenibacillus sp. J22TS3]
MRRRRFDRASRLAAVAGICMLLITSLSGCMYPQEKRGGQVSYRESVNRIQMAVDQFQKDKGILPILNADQDTPRYEKFRIDLDKLNKAGYMDEIPATAFEKGGSAYFLIQNEETKPEVKVMELTTVQKVNDVQRAVDKYKAAHQGQLPVLKEAYPGINAVDLKAIQSESLAWKSFYSGQEADYLMDRQGQVYVDYALDIMQAVEKSGTKPEQNVDLRPLLLDQSYFVPVKSLPYHWQNNLPVAVDA